MSLAASVDWPTENRLLSLCQMGFSRSEALRATAELKQRGGARASLCRPAVLAQLLRGMHDEASDSTSEDGGGGDDDSSPRADEVDELREARCDELLSIESIVGESRATALTW